HHEGDAGAADRFTRMRDELIERARGYAPALTPDQFFNHSTGLAVLGVPLPYDHADRYELHISARRPNAQPIRAGAVGHRLQKREPARCTASGLPIEHPARLWRQAASLWSLDDIIIAGDHLVSPRNRLLSIDDLWREID